VDNYTGVVHRVSTWWRLFSAFVRDSQRTLSETLRYLTRRERETPGLSSGRNPGDHFQLHLNGVATALTLGRGLVGCQLFIDSEC